MSQSLEYSTYRSDYRLASVIGAILKNYDKAIFGLTAPFIAPLFFHTNDPVTALVLMYAMFPFSSLARPIGSLFFGWMGDRFGRKHALICSLIGMGLSTTSLGFLPTYASIGNLCPILLFFGRALQNFCSAGESTGSAIFFLEHTQQKKRSLMSSIYDASAMSGIFIASLLVTILSANGAIVEDWRLLYWLGGATAIFGILLRLRSQESYEFIEMKKTKQTHFLSVFREHKKTILVLAIASGFSYMTYIMSFTFMNGYIPLVSNLSKARVTEINTYLLVLDMLLLPCFGLVAQKIGKEKLMIGSSLGLACIALPAFSLLQNPTLATVIAVRILIIVGGVAFASVYHAWALELAPPQHRFTILSLGSALGAQCIGAPACAISLWLFQTTHLPIAPALYLIAISSLAGGVLYLQYAKKLKESYSEKRTAI